MLVTVLAAVDLNDEATIEADKIHEVRTESVLAAKPGAP